MSTPSAPASPLEALKAGFRRACVRRLVGDEAGAIDVLKNEIPKLVDFENARPQRYARRVLFDPATCR